ncbi:MAG: hypothetical protein JSS66_05115 [Armatimonadetes bacterium]|nr:hypothetical protein [Armatimonadota bacterium]
MRRCADLSKQIQELETQKVDTGTQAIQRQLGESPEAPPSSVAVHVTPAMGECISAVEYTFTPVLLQTPLSDEAKTLYTSLVRCYTQFKHEEHALRSLLMLRYQFAGTQGGDFDRRVDELLKGHDNRRLESFREMTYVMWQMSQLRSLREAGLDSVILPLVDRCESALGTDVTLYDMG